MSSNQRGFATNPELDALVDRAVDIGPYGSFSELARDALREHSEQVLEEYDEDDGYQPGEGGEQMVAEIVGENGSRTTN